MHTIFGFVRRDVLAIIGVFGLAMNILGAFGPFINLASAARYIVDHWVDFSAEIWVWLFSLVQLEIPPLLGFALSFVVFHAGLVLSTVRHSGGNNDYAAPLPTRTESRDRLICLMLYIPIMGSTLFIAFFKLAEASIQASSTNSSALVTVALLLVVASPIAAFLLISPRKLMRRFFSVYAVTIAVLLLDGASQILSSFGFAKSSA